MDDLLLTEREREIIWLALNFTHTHISNDCRDGKPYEASRQGQLLAAEMLPLHKRIKTILPDEGKKALEDWNRLKIMGYV